MKLETGKYWSHSIANTLDCLLDNTGEEAVTIQCLTRHCLHRCVGAPYPLTAHIKAAGVVEFHFGDLKLTVSQNDPDKMEKLLLLATKAASDTRDAWEVFDGEHRHTVGQTQGPTCP